MTRIWIGLLLTAAGLSQETFHIAGTVVNSQTGQPVKGALVTVRGRSQFVRGVDKPPAAHPPNEIMTDSAGRFAAEGLPTGIFNVTVEKNGFAGNVPAGDGQVTVGPSRDGLSITLSPLAIVSGRVTDGDGDPVPFASVRAVTSDIRDGTRTLRQARSVSTDDQGRYRMWNFTPGEYYIATAGRTGGTQAVVGVALAAGAGGPEAFAPVYYPAGRDRASAAPIALASGQEFTADLRVFMEPSFRIRGTLRGAAPYQPVRVDLLRGPGDLNATRALVNSTTGRFEVREVVPGTYLLRATQGTGKKEVRAEEQVQVAQADVSGVLLDLLPGVTVTGVVRMPATPSADSPAGLSQERFSGFASVTLLPVGEFAAPALNGRADQQGQFSIEGVVPGRYRLTAQAFGGYVASAVSGRLDLLRGELLVGAGTAPEPVEIDVRNDGGMVSAHIEADRGWVLLAAVNGGEIQRGMATGGTAQFVNLAPGQYQVFWVKEIERLEFRNPAVLRALRGGVTVQVTSSATATATLKEMAQ